MFYQFDESGSGEFGSTEGGFAPAQRRLAEQLNSYWANFARTGDPNDAGLPPWPAFAPTARYVQSLVPAPTGIHPVDYSAEHHLPFWRALAP